MKKQISIIGSGNLAWHLAPALENAGYPVQEIYSRNPAHADALVGHLYAAEVKASLDFSTSSSGIFIIATADDAIESISQELVLPEGAILLHTSGTKPLSILGYAATPDIGVFYPLQTFTKTRKMNFKEVPVFIEAENEKTESVLLDMARGISDNVHKINSKERRALHVAAVFASNFTNHMLLLSQEIMREHSLSYDWLKPLVAEMINKSLAIGPENAQTGPARRGDFDILDQHTEFLQDDESLNEIYRLISQDIIDRYSDGIDK
jgi:predicted short-subunit dehydrogenase-like oxidoreductase (DUF2520 family)